MKKNQHLKESQILFAEVTKRFSQLIKAFGVVNEHPVHQFFCSMALDGKKDIGFKIIKHQ
jgi:hypothetical protein